MHEKHSLITSQFYVPQQNGETAIHIASRHGFLKMVQELLEEGADPVCLSKVKHYVYLPVCLSFCRVFDINMYFDNGTRIAKGRCRPSVFVEGKPLYPSV